MDDSDDDDDDDDESMFSKQEDGEYRQVNAREWTSALYPGQQ